VNASARVSLVGCQWWPTLWNERLKMSDANRLLISATDRQNHVVQDVGASIGFVRKREIVMSLRRKLVSASPATVPCPAIRETT
jgi:hypothetical protein